MASVKTHPPSLSPSKVAALLILTFTTAFFWGRQSNLKTGWQRLSPSSDGGASVITRTNSKEKQTMNQAELEITTSPWNGWSPAQPNHQTTLAKVTTHDQLKLESSFGRYFYQVSHLDEQQITFSIISSSTPVAVKDGGINLLETVPEFTLTPQQSIRLATPSMDAGVVWTVTLKKITTP